MLLKMMVTLVVLVATMTICNEVSATTLIRPKRNPFPQFGPTFNSASASASASATSFGAGSASASATSSLFGPPSPSFSAFPSSALGSTRGVDSPLLSSNPFFNGVFNAGRGNTRFGTGGNGNELTSNEFDNTENLNEFDSNFGSSTGPVASNPPLRERPNPQPFVPSNGPLNNNIPQRERPDPHPFGSHSRAPPGFGFQAGYAGQNPN